MTNLSKDEELKTYLRESVQLIFDRVNEQFDRSELFSHFIKNWIFG